MRFLEILTPQQPGIEKEGPPVWKPSLSLSWTMCLASWWALCYTPQVERSCAVGRTQLSHRQGYHQEEVIRAEISIDPTEELGRDRDGSRMLGSCLPSDRVCLILKKECQDNRICEVCLSYLPVPLKSQDQVPHMDTNWLGNP